MQRGFCQNTSELRRSHCKTNSNGEFTIISTNPSLKSVSNYLEFYLTNGHLMVRICQLPETGTKLVPKMPLTSAFHPKNGWLAKAN
jgi:hypothetical protein